jgi:hypothetical protein
VRRVAEFAFVAAAVVFCVVQDRVTAAGVREYVERQRQALAGPEGMPLRRSGKQAPAVRLDDVMGPAKRRSVEQGLLWGGVAGAVGLGSGAIVGRRRRG